jgi:hypothetical protein
MFLAKKVCTAFTRRNSKIVPLINLNKYLYEVKISIKLNINSSREKERRLSNCAQ